MIFPFLSFVNGYSSASLLDPNQYNNRLSNPPTTPQPQNPFISLENLGHAVGSPDSKDMVFF